MKVAINPRTGCVNIYFDKETSGKLLWTAHKHKGNLLGIDVLAQEIMLDIIEKTKQWIKDNNVIMKKRPPVTVNEE
jgi:hypothetical protein